MRNPPRTASNSLPDGTGPRRGPPQALLEKDGQLAAFFRRAKAEAANASDVASVETRPLAEVPTGPAKEDNASASAAGDLATEASQLELGAAMKSSVGKSVTHRGAGCAQYSGSTRGPTRPGSVGDRIRPAACRNTSLSRRLTAGLGTGAAMGTGTGSPAAERWLALREDSAARACCGRGRTLQSQSRTPRWREERRGQAFQDRRALAD